MIQICNCPNHQFLLTYCIPLLDTQRVFTYLQHAFCSSKHQFEAPNYDILTIFVTQNSTEESIVLEFRSYILTVSPIPEISPGGQDSVSAMCQQLSQGLSLLSSSDDFGPIPTQSSTSSVAKQLFSSTTANKTPPGTL